MEKWFTLNNVMLLFGVTAGLVSVFELLEFLFTKNIPWLWRIARQVWRKIRWSFGKKADDGEVQRLILNFSGHPVTPAQQQAIEKQMHWTSSSVVDVRLGNVPEDNNFAAAITKAIDRTELSPEEWQTTPFVAVPAGYPAAWSVILASLHGRLGHFPDVARLRPTPPGASEKYEVAEILNLREHRHASRDKR
ncbi:MAG: hypothetical protein HGA83_02445 [Bacteroidales bacterium]|nr:hypothetical protein [Bacteroidales bacterium]